MQREKVSWRGPRGKLSTWSSRCFPFVSRHREREREREGEGEGEGEGEVHPRSFAFYRREREDASLSAHHSSLRSSTASPSHLPSRTSPPPSPLCSSPLSQLYQEFPDLGLPLTASTGRSLSIPREESNLIRNSQNQCSI